MKPRALVIGVGIAGLSAAYHLHPWGVGSPFTPSAAEVRTAPPSWARPLLATRYRSTVNLGIVAGRDWDGQAVLGEACGMLIPRRERKNIPRLRWNHTNTRPARRKANCRA